jgi:hypothetical protein
MRDWDIRHRFLDIQIDAGGEDDLRCPESGWEKGLHLL